MPLVTSTLSVGAVGNRVTAVHAELAVIGGSVNEDEITANTFGATTQKAVLDFQERYGLEQTGTVDPPTGALMLATARFATEGNTPEIRQELEMATNANLNQPALGYTLTRYELLVGNYDAARSIFSNLGTSSELDESRETLGAILDSSVDVRDIPEVPYPGNFYTYRYSFFGLEKIERLHEFLASAGFSGSEVNDGSNFRFLYANNAPSTNPQPDTLEPLPDTPKPRPPKPISEPDLRQRGGLAGYQATTALRHWHLGNQDMGRGLYSRAIKHYDACQAAAIRYFLIQYPSFRTASELDEQLKLLISDLFLNRKQRRQFWIVFGARQQTLSIRRLHGIDWVTPVEIINNNGYSRGDKFLDLLSLSDGVPDEFRQLVIEVPLVTLAYVLVPLARAEANRQRRNFQDALDDCDRVLNPLIIKKNPDLLEGGGSFNSNRPVGPLILGESTAPFRLASEFIELSFARTLKAQILLDRADTEYKARKQPQATQTYQEVIELFANNGAYKTNIEGAVTLLQNEVDTFLNKRFHPLTPSDAGSTRLTETERREFEILGKGMPINTIEAETDALPGLDRRSAPNEPLLRFTATDGATNPLIFALMTEARARLLQISNGFNYLGYSDEYIPPWRFQFLLERARYFAEHAKNAQREYLNFLSNAEREEFQEITSAQSVELEKSNIRIETVRVDQSSAEIEAAKLGQELAVLQANNTQKRFDEYEDFDKDITDLEMDIMGANNFAAVGSLGSSIIQGALTGAAAGGPVGAAVGAGLGLVFGGASELGRTRVQEAEQAISARGRELEKFNLGLAISEAEKSAEVATAQLDVANAGLVVAGLQRAAALLRHEFALQSLNFLRNRTLSPETWYRLSAMIRSVAETYMRYAVELAFLAEQAYEFEADKRINVIRFDYDVSEVGNLLAADFLLRDLDTLEQDLIVNQRQRQQQVRYVLSMAREFPEALQELRENSSTIFSLRLEQLERRFPGLFNIRIGAVDVTPIAIMDPTRFSLELTYLGSSQVRLKANPDTPPGVASTTPLNNTDFTDASDQPADPWLSPVIAEQWPVKIRVTGPETNVYSGLTRQEISAVFPFISSGQRNAFESRGAAASWRVDMSMKENQVVPETLADVLFTFTPIGLLRRQPAHGNRQCAASSKRLNPVLLGQAAFPRRLLPFCQRRCNGMGHSSGVTHTRCDTGNTTQCGLSAGTEQQSVKLYTAAFDQQCRIYNR